MKKLIFILLLIPSLCLGQKLGIKTGTLIYKSTPVSKYGTPATVFSPLIGITYQHSFKRVLVGIEPSYTQIKTVTVYEITSDNAGNKLEVKQKNISKSTYEIPVYIGYQVLNNEFNLIPNLGISVFDKSASMFFGITAGYNIKRVSINANYKINGLIYNQFTNSYHALYLTTSYKF